jgi:chromosome segregation ATPase
LLRNEQNDNLIQLEHLNKQKQELEKRVSHLELDYNKLKQQERDNAIKEAQELRKKKEDTFANSDMTALSFPQVNWNKQLNFLVIP